MVVDDSVVIRKLLKTVIDREADMEVTSVAANGSIALRKIDQCPPDLITMDLDMPELDGLQTVRAIREQKLDIRVIMVSAATDQGAEQTLDCLNAGADDFILKPKHAETFEDSIRLIRTALIPKIRALRPKAPDITVHVRDASNQVVVDRITTGRTAISAIVVGSSTGGPAALDEFFQNLGGNLGVPVFVVQHMPPEFTANLAKRLNEKHPLTFVEGIDGTLVEDDHVYIAPGGVHMELQRKPGGIVVVKNTKGPLENYCRPAVDVLFRSAVSCYGDELLGVVLTGMGRDGAAGARHITAVGGSVYVQDRESSVVWGMPGAVVEIGVQRDILPVAKIAVQIRKHLGVFAI